MWHHRLHDKPKTDPISTVSITHDWSYWYKSELSRSTRQIFSLQTVKKKKKIPQPFPRTRLSKQIHNLDLVAKSRDLIDPDGSISVTSIERASISTPAQACAVEHLHCYTKQYVSFKNTKWLAIIHWDRKQIATPQM